MKYNFINIKFCQHIEVSFQITLSHHLVISVNVIKSKLLYINCYNFYFFVDAGQGDVSESQQKDENEAKATKTAPERDEIENRDNRSERPMGRGGSRNMRGDNRVRGWGGSSSSYFRGAVWRGADRGRRSQQRRPHMGRSEPWQHSESEDEVSASTESGKEDKRQDQERKHYPR